MSKIFFRGFKINTNTLKGNIKMKVNPISFSGKTTVPKKVSCRLDYKRYVENLESRRYDSISTNRYSIQPGFESPKPVNPDIPAFRESVGAKILDFLKGLVTRL